ncbi:MAG: LamG-like jellyroll fold domain-containing protein [Candidatus Kapaibacteriota bacterium]
MPFFPFNLNLRYNWVCYSMVFENNLLKAYVNGNLVGSIQTKIYYSLENFAFCRSWWFYDGEERTCARFTGAIDEVKIYLRALSEAEIAL